MNVIARSNASVRSAPKVSGTRNTASAATTMPSE